MNIFDDSELNKKLAEAEASFGVEEETKEADEVPENKAEVAEPEDKEEEAKEIEEEEPLAEDEDERPTDPKGWKKLREKKKAATLEAKEQRLLAEKAAKETAELRERLARLEGREDARAKPVVQDTDPEPDKDLDPDLHIRWELRQTNKRVEEAERRASVAEAMAKGEGARRGLQMLEKEYVRNNKMDDYDSAIEHIKTVQKNLILLEYPQATDAQIDAHLEAERVKLAEQSYSRGINPAEHFYKMAKTLGYTKKAASSKPDISSLNRNMAKNANLIGSSNVDNTGTLPTERVVAMSIDQLLKAEGTAALEAAIKREESKMLGL